MRVLGRGGFRRLAYAVWGSPRADRTVICLHGVSRSGRDFDILAAALAEHGVRVVAPDLPGHGRSEWLASPSHYDDDAYAGAMSTLIARLEVEEVDWVGTSLGGHIGMLLAAEHATPVRRLVRRPQAGGTAAVKAVAVAAATSSLRVVLFTCAASR